MRRIGNLPDASLAERFCDYLVTQSIRASWEPADAGEEGGCDIWIRDETDLERAREELREFEQSPRDAKYDVKEKASRLRQQRAAENARRLKNQRNVGKSMASAPPRGGFGGSMFGGMGRQSRIPVTITVIVLSVLASFYTNFGQLPDLSNGTDVEQLSTQAKVFRAMSFVDRPTWEATGRDSFASIRQGEIWRLITPMFLHGDTIHLLFNMLWVYSLGSMIERYHGSLFFVALLLSTEITGMLVQVLLPDWLPPSLRGYPFAIGASGAVYGLFGFLWIRPQIAPMYPIRLPSSTVMIMLGFLVICLTGIFNVANGAHIGGLLGGTLAAAAWPRSV